jgi:sugar porter (SP) family MFS transporter
MMSLINTNHNYLRTMHISSSSPLVGVIVGVYYLGCAVGAVIFSKLGDKLGRKKAIFGCLATAALGNLIMFITGLGSWTKGTLETMMLGRTIMGLGVGGVEACVTLYSSELASDDARGKALAQEFQMNIFGLNMAFGINLGVTRALGKDNQWAWRIPIMVMQAYTVLLLAVIDRLPESPRWFLRQGMEKEAKDAMIIINGQEEGEEKFKALMESAQQEAEKHVSYLNMLTPGHPQFHPTIISIMGQINQALTGYGAVSVYGPQIFELLGFRVKMAEDLTQANYISYFIFMTFAWLLIDAVGRRRLMVIGSAVLTTSFALLALFGGLAMNTDHINIPALAPAIPGTIALFVATWAFGIGWLSTVWLIPTELFPTTARGQAAAISVIVWGLANFAVTFLTPVMFNNLRYYIFLVFAVSNAFAGIWTWIYLPESGNRSFDENQQFFEDAARDGSWRVSQVDGGKYLKMPYGDKGEDAERTPLLHRVEDQMTL